MRQYRDNLILELTVQLRSWPENTYGPDSVGKQEREFCIGDATLKKWMEWGCWLPRPSLSRAWDVPVVEARTYQEKSRLSARGRGGWGRNPRPWAGLGVNAPGGLAALSSRA